MEEGTKIISAASTLIAFVVLIAVVWGLGGKPALSIGPAIETVIESGDTRN